MCGRYGLITQKDTAKFYKRFRLNGKTDLTDNFNAAPSQVMPTITMESPDRLSLMGWGHTLAFGDKSFPIINAKSEKLSSFSYKKSFQNRRCLVPASHFYEWDKLSGSKIPYLIKLKNTDHFAFAGIYFDKNNFVILTTSPNDMVGKIHNRQPVILSEEAEETWLNPDSDEDALIALTQPLNADVMEMYEISRLVNSPKNNVEEVIKPFAN